METGEQGGTPGKAAGKGYLGSEEHAFTVVRSQDQWLAQSVGTLDTECGFGKQTHQSVVNGHIIPCVDPSIIQASELRLRGKITEQKVCPTLKAGTKQGDTEPLAFQHNISVRRLTPLECERLQGFPDNHSRIPWKGKPEEDCPDGPRYKACGNSMAVPVMSWIGKRLKDFKTKHNV